nr:PREDICTED: HCLS1-binding protein 3 [Latimeria chalumnae]|eukprot:XP_014346244.1 PREDICTED: HCLS1-binding protein 3 [Latimeria chalumnae]
MPEGLITTRQIQNVHTGIDLAVPEYQEIRGAMMTGHVEYHVVVVTRLAAFKSAKHKPEDVVQLVVSKKYSEFDEFYQKLAAQNPKAMLPPMPRKVLFVGETDIKERRAAFDEIMRFISKDQTLVTSPELLEFLGMCKTLQQNTSNAIIDLNSMELGKKERTKKPKKKLTPAPPLAPAVKPKLSLFDEEVDPDDGLFEVAQNSSARAIKKKSTGNDSFRLFEDPDLGGTIRAGDSLLLPAACESKAAISSTSLDDDMEELFRVEDNLDRLLKLGSSSKPAAKPKPKPKLLPKPTLPKKPAATTASSSQPAPSAPTLEYNVENMDEVDILKYIQQNESTSSETLDLF